MTTPAKSLSKKAWLFLSFICVLGLGTLLLGGWTWKVADVPKFLAYLAIALLASRLKVLLPEITGTISMNFLFILIGIVELNFSETLVIGCMAIVAQCLISRTRWPRPEQVIFNVCSAALAIWAAYFTYHSPFQKV